MILLPKCKCCGVCTYWDNRSSVTDRPDSVEVDTSGFSEQYYTATFGAFGTTRCSAFYAAAGAGNVSCSLPKTYDDAYSGGTSSYARGYTDAACYIGCEAVGASAAHMLTIGRLMRIRGSLDTPYSKAAMSYTDWYGVTSTQQRAWTGRVYKNCSNGAYSYSAERPQGNGPNSYPNGFNGTTAFAFNIKASSTTFTSGCKLPVTLSITYIFAVQSPSTLISTTFPDTFTPPAGYSAAIGFTETIDVTDLRMIYGMTTVNGLYGDVGDTSCTNSTFSNSDWP